MAAYNRVNGTHMTEHEDLLQDVLRQEWEFEGVVVSDWWATRSTIASALAGLDIEMPGLHPGAFGTDHGVADTDSVLLASGNRSRRPSETGACPRT